MSPALAVSTPNPVRLGVIGCGNVLSAYQPAIQKLQLQHALDWVIACGREHQRHDVLHHSPDLQFTSDESDVLNAPDVDLVLLLTPPAEHARLSAKALQSGKHVVTEKPFAVSLEEASNVITLSQQTERMLICAPFTILSPTFQTISRRLQHGHIGQPSLARARYGWSGPWWNQWFYQQNGGCLFDLGIYCVTTLTGLLGPVRRVCAMTGTSNTSRTVNGAPASVQAEDAAHVLLDFGNALFASIMTGFTIQQYRSPALEIYGSTGAIQMMGDDWDPDGYELWQNSAGAWQIFKETAPDWPWTDGLNHAVDCIRHKTPSVLTLEHAYHVLEILLQARASGCDGQFRTINSSFVRPQFAGVPAAEPAHLIHDRSRAHAPSGESKGAA